MPLDFIRRAVIVQPMAVRPGPEQAHLLELAQRLLTLPTAPYHEHRVRSVVEAHCRRLGLPVASDRAGNVIVRYQHGSRRPPLVFLAHMDHPGFVAHGGGRTEFFGGAPREMFSRAALRFYVGEKIVRARVTSVTTKLWPRRKRLRIRAPETVPSGAVGAWDVPAFQVRRGRLCAATIDDVLGVAVLAALLSALVRRRVFTHVWTVFTRAEEVGFQGAVALARSGRIPQAALVISVEMSQARPWARIGDGPVVRVGDRRTMFDPAASWFLEETARRSTIRAQRCLMDGGSCEATALAAFGYRVGGLCLPLGNYHNIGPGHRARSEFVSVADLDGLRQLTLAAAQQWNQPATFSGGVRALLARLAREYPEKLMAT
jgi:endoglucanase